MKLIHSHDTLGSGHVMVSAPELRVEITVDSAARSRQAHVKLSGPGTAHAGPGGTGGRELHVIAGKQGLLNSVVDHLGMRKGSTISGGSRIAASGSSSVVAVGGSIRSNAIGRESWVSINSQPVSSRENGVYLTLPKGCSADIRKRDGICVYCDGGELTIERAVQCGFLVTR